MASDFGVREQVLIEPYALAMAQVPCSGLSFRQMRDGNGSISLHWPCAFRNDLASGYGRDAQHSPFHFLSISV